MNYPFKILFQSFVKPFYKENAGVFVFLFITMFCIISKVDGAGVFEYHYSLIIGMLKNSSFLLFVFAAWAIYCRKHVAFVTNVLYKPEYTFIDIFTRLRQARQFGLFLAVEVLLLMPVLLYALIVIAVGCLQHYYTPVFFVFGYLSLLCVATAAWHVYLLNNFHKNGTVARQQRKHWPVLPTIYSAVLIRFIANRQKVIWIGMKIFTCGILYLVCRNNTATDYDTSFPFLFFNFGILAQGILVYRVRAFEETCLTFYRAAPVSLLKRLSGYLLVYFVLLAPEFITAGVLVPVFLHIGDAISFSLCGYSLLLFVNSITFLQNFSTKEYLKILLLIFCAEYIFLITIGLTFLYLLLLVLAVIIFLIGYYKFEHTA